MTVGCLSVNAQEACQCGILASGWPSWAFGAKARGWIIEVIILKDNYRIIQQLFPDSVVILFEAGLTLSGILSKINTWFSDIDPPRSLALWASDAEFVVTSRRARHVNDPSWKNGTKENFPHSMWGRFRWGMGFLHLLKGISSLVPQ